MPGRAAGMEVDLCVLRVLLEEPVDERAFLGLWLVLVAHPALSEAPALVVFGRELAWDRAGVVNGDYRPRGHEEL